MQGMMTSVSTATAVTTLACTDVVEETKFYSEMIGFDTMMMEEMPGYAAVKAGNGTWFMVYQRPTPPNCDTTALTLLVDDVMTSVDELRGRGVMFEEYDMPGLRTVNGIATMPDGSKSAWFRDPAGNTLSIAEMSASQKRAMMANM